MGPSRHDDCAGYPRDRAFDAACLAEHSVFVFEARNDRPFQRIHSFSDQKALGIEFNVECPRIRSKSAEFFKLLLIMRDRHIVSSLADAGNNRSGEDVLLIFCIEYFGILGILAPEMLFSRSGYENELAGRLGGPRDHLCFFERLKSA